MSVILLLVVLVGFSRTFFLRTFFAVPPIPPHVYLHGAILTSWFVWFCLQVSLVARGCRGLHRTLGKVGATLGVAVIVANLTVLAGVAPRLRVVFLEEKLDPAFVTRAIWGDFGSTLAFAVFLGSGLWFRNRADVHGRLMLLASVSLIGPALGRLVVWPALAGIDGIKLLPHGGLAFFLASLWLYDLLTIGRVHRATLLGSIFRIVLVIGVGAIAASEFGQRVVRGLAGL